MILFRDSYDKEKYIEDCGNYIKAVGGDGTLLRAINLYSELDKPFFGVAKGTVNFLMNKRDSVDEYTHFQKLNLIKIRVEYDNFHKRTIFAFNDVMIGGDMNSWIEFNVEEKDGMFGDFRGGGIIISTPQGSTGINKNNNGPILPLSTDLWSITGDKCNRKIEYVIEPRETVISVKSRTPVTLWADGSNTVIKNVQRVTISSGDSVEVLFNDFEEFIKKRRI